ncbi:MAG: hypothetical protein AB1502_00140 [Thermodesulfobacteriota bacterium]
MDSKLRTPVRNGFPPGQKPLWGGAKPFPTELRTIFPRKNSLDEILLQLTRVGLPAQPVSSRKVLFWGERAGEISSYVAGWMAGKGMDVIVLDGANRFDPYMVSTFARKALIPPERLLKRIRIARAFTCYQMATLMGERLISLVGAIRAMPASRQESPLQKPWVILLGPITTFLDEDVPEREVRPLFERSLKKIEEMALRGIPFFLFQPSGFSENPPFPPFSKGRMGRLMESRRTYLMRRLFQFSSLAWRICLEDQGPKMILEKRLYKHQIPSTNIQIITNIQ